MMMMMMMSVVSVGQSHTIITWASNARLLHLLRACTSRLHGSSVEVAGVGTRQNPLLISLAGVGTGIIWRLGASRPPDPSLGPAAR